MEPNKSSILNIETVRSVLETVREEYFDQERRHNLVISKIQTLATVATLAFAVIAASGQSSESSRLAHWLSVGGYLLALLGVATCLYALKSQDFHRIRYSAALDDKELSKPTEIVMLNLAKTYDEAKVKNDAPLKSLVDLFDRAVYFVVTSSVLAGISVLIKALWG